MSKSRKKSFWEVLKDQVCELEPLVRALFGLSSAVLVLLLISLTVVDRSSATYVIVVVDLVGVIVITAIMAAVLYVCESER